MQIKTLEVAGFISALKAMRNPMNSWNKNDSIKTKLGIDKVKLGENDTDLSVRLTKAGSEHCKHLRMIHVWCDMDLPRYIHSELDTYKFNTHISCSSMHKLHSRYLIESDFQDNDVSEHTLEEINGLIDIYNDSKDIKIKNELKRKMKKKLPDGYLQMRTYDFNYAELLNIYYQRKNHKLSDWHVICNWILNLPNFKELTGVE